MAPTTPPSLLTGPIDGVDQAGCTFPTFNCRPPDPHIAAGGGRSQHVVEIGNSFLSVYDHSGSQLLATSLNAFFGVPEPPPFERILFDPRVVYDPVWNRWVLTADSFPISPTLQVFYLAVSLSDDATGPYYLYSFNVTLPNQQGFLFDYPQLGFDQDAVIVSANIYDVTIPEEPFQYAEVFAIAKARLYNGLGFVVPVFTALGGHEGTLAPPLVQDQNPVAYLIAATAPATVSTNLQLYALRNSSRPEGTSLTFQAQVPVEPYRLPPHAAQPNSNVLLDTLDARFVNASTQLGNVLYQVHTIAFSSTGGPPTPRWYKIDTRANTVLVQQAFFASDTSNDWNASIAANAQDEVFVTWSSTEPGRVGVNPEVRISGKQPSDPSIPSGISVEVSPTAYTDNRQPGVTVRWGDYSAVALDPVGTAGCDPFRRAWIANEKAKQLAFWGTTLAQIGFCGASTPTGPRPPR